MYNLSMICVRFKKVNDFNNKVKMMVKKEVVARSNIAFFMALLFALICIFFFSTLVSADLYLNSIENSEPFTNLLSEFSKVQFFEEGERIVHTSDFFVNTNLGKSGDWWRN